MPLIHFELPDSLDLKVFKYRKKHPELPSKSAAIIDMLKKFKDVEK